MNFRHTLLVSAMVAAPVLLTEQAPARTLVQLYKDLASEPKDVDATPGRRAGSFPSLAMMPTDVEACFALDSIKGVNIPFLTTTPGTGFDNPKVKEHVESLGIAVGKGNAADLAAFMPVYQYLVGLEKYPARALDWAESARAEYASIIEGQVKTSAKKPALDAIRKIQNMHLHPVYVSVTTDVPAHRYLMEVAEEYIASFEKQYSASRVEESGWKGVKIPFSSLFAKPQGDASIETTLREQIDSRSLYVLFKQQGGALVISVCEDPKEVSIADSADKSVLSAPTMMFCDKYLMSDIVTAGYISPELLNALNAYQQYDIDAFGDFARDVFRAMGEEDDANVTAYNNASSAIKPVVDYACSYVRTDADKPFTFCVWPQDDGTHVKVSFDAYDATYKPGHLRLGRVARSKKVFFYAESTEEVNPKAKTTIDALDPMLHLAAGYVTSMEPVKAAEAGGDRFLTYMPRVKSIMRSVRAADAALGDVPAFVAMPLKDGSTAVSYFNSVKDRAALGKAGDEIVTGMGRMLGGKADFLRKKVKSKKSKTAVTHTADMSDLMGAGSELNVTISEKDKTFAFGNSSALNGQVIKNGVGKINFTGAVYTVRPAAIAVAAETAPEAAMLSAFTGGVEAIHATNTIKDDVRTLHVLLAVPGEEDEEE